MSITIQAEGEASKREAACLRQPTLIPFTQPCEADQAKEVLPLGTKKPICFQQLVKIDVEDQAKEWTKGN